MNDFKWQEDNWTALELEEGIEVDVNFWIDDKSGRQYIAFYPTFTNHKGWKETNAITPIATYRVIKEEVSKR
tara:strand:- start:419 stop:634 length:216 start_codon:yes stop_codon:yes gene_type:complete